MQSESEKPEKPRFRWERLLDSPWKPRREARPDEGAAKRVVGRRAEGFLSTVFHVEAIKDGGKVVSEGLRLATSKPKSREKRRETFAQARRRLGVDEERLEKVMAGLVSQHRSYLLLTFIAAWFAGVGMYLLSVRPFDLVNLNLFVISFCLMLLFGVLNMKASFRLWQCRRRELLGLNHFWADVGPRFLFSFTL